MSITKGKLAGFTVSNHPAQEMVRILRLPAGQQQKALIQFAEKSRAYWRAAGRRRVEEMIGRDR